MKKPRSPRSIAPRIVTLSAEALAHVRGGTAKPSSDNDETRLQDEEAPGDEEPILT
jgi:hypothetical protein